MNIEKLLIEDDLCSSMDDFNSRHDDPTTRCGPSHHSNSRNLNQSQVNGDTNWTELKPHEFLTTWKKSVSAKNSCKISEIKVSDRETASTGEEKTSTQIQDSSDGSIFAPQNRAPLDIPNCWGLSPMTSPFNVTRWGTSFLRPDNRRPSAFSPYQSSLAEETELYSGHKLQSRSQTTDFSSRQTFHLLSEPASSNTSTSTFSTKTCSSPSNSDVLTTKNYVDAVSKATPPLYLPFRHVYRVPAKSSSDWCDMDTPHGFSSTYQQDIDVARNLPPVFPRRRRKETNTRRQRTTFTSDQTLKLELEYQRTEYITRPRRFELAERLALSETQIKIWFQNRRAKDKRIEKAQVDQHIRCMGMRSAGGACYGVSVGLPHYGDLLAGLHTSLRNVVPGNSHPKTAAQSGYVQSCTN